MFDSARWLGFGFRPDDIVISTPPKSGTTWTQMLCAMLVLGGPDLDRPLEQLSPWLDMRTRSLAEVTAHLEAQEHRRFIKTHTPLDGLPWHPEVTYICVGRDPRDVFVSWSHHMENLDLDALRAAREAAEGPDTEGELGPAAPGGEDGGVSARFRRWVDDRSDYTTGGHLAFVLHHLRTFWDRRGQPNVRLFHYGDLQADLPGQLRRLAGVLGIPLDLHRAGELAAAASFEAMRARADELAPDVGHRIWRSNRDFFRSGSSGGWRAHLDRSDLDHYRSQVSQLATPELAAWVHSGWTGRAQRWAGPADQPESP